MSDDADLMDLKLRHLCREIDRHGAVRFYFRKGKGPRIAIEGDPGSAEFLESYRAALEGGPQKQPRTTTPEIRKNTLRWLCHEYYASAEFRQLDPHTQHVRRQILEHCLNEPTVPGGAHLYAEIPLDRISLKAIKVLRNRKMDSPAAANSRVKALRQVFSFAMDEEDDRGNPLMERNPAKDVTYLAGSPHGLHAWTLEEVEQFEARHPIGTKARLALALLLYTTQRRSDIVLLGRQHVRNGTLTLTQFKNRNRKPVTVEIDIIPALREIIDRSPTGDLHFLITKFGKPFTSNGFGNWFRKRCNEAGLPQCAAHGLRKVSIARLAELGCSDRQIMSVSGHATEKEITRYTKSARQKVLAKAAMKKLARNTR